MSVQEGSSIPPKKVWTASEMGRVGGPLGGKARAAKLSKRRRKAIAKNAAIIRWRREALKKAEAKDEV